MPQPLDQLDVHIIAELRRHPRTSMADLARSLGVARGTVTPDSTDSRTLA